jgi:hypothetical protein
METKYKALRALSWIYRLIGALSFIGGIVLSVLDKVMLPAVIGVITALVLIAAAEMLQLAIAVEDNTARSAHFLARMTGKRRDD